MTISDSLGDTSNPSTPSNHDDLELWIVCESINRDTDEPPNPLLMDVKEEMKEELHSDDDPDPDPDPDPEFQILQVPKTLSIKFICINFMYDFSYLRQTL